MPNRNIDLEISVKNSLDKVRIIYKSFLLFIKKDFLLRNENKAHNLTNHIENFKEKIKINQQAENNYRYQKYDIHYVNFWINIWNEIDWKIKQIIELNKKISLEKIQESSHRFMNKFMKTNKVSPL